MTNIDPPFKHDVQHCCCLGSGWFDKGPEDYEDWIKCPFHYNDNHPSPITELEDYFRFCDRLWYNRRIKV